MLTFAALALILGQSSWHFVQVPGADGGSVTTYGAPPKALSCLPNWYAGTVTLKPDKGWGLMLDGGIFLDWDTGVQITDPEVEESSDLKDIFRTRYRPGPIIALDSRDAGPIDDPGRIRVEQLFSQTYGATPDEVEAHIAKVRFFGTRYAFHEKAAPALERVVDRLELAKKRNPSIRVFLQKIGGTWAWRKIDRSNNLSAHAWAIAIDLNTERSNYWRWTRRGEPLTWRNKIPQEVVDAFEAEGFIWGGRWLHFDTMHFEYRPELLSPLCY